jgi:hypothetical protein
MNMDEYSQIDTHSKNVISANVNVHHPHQLTSCKRTHTLLEIERDEGGRERARGREERWERERDEDYTFTVGGIIMKIAQVLVFKHKKPAINGLQKLECLDVWTTILFRF